MTSRRACIAVAAIVAAMACGAPARAQDTSTLKKDMVGQWELSTTERSKTCVVTLKSDATALGMKLELEPGCPKALPFTAGVICNKVAQEMGAFVHGPHRAIRPSFNPSFRL